VLRLLILKNVANVEREQKKVHSPDKTENKMKNEQHNSVYAPGDTKK
jgi:hypothetical protein